MHARFKAHPILWAWLAIFIAETSFNAVYGWRYFGPLYAALFAALAVLGAWAADALSCVEGQTKTAWVKRCSYGVFAGLALVLSQFSGWSVMGVTISDGLAKRDVAADNTSDLRAQLKAKRAALAERQDVAAAAEIEAQIAVLLATYVRKADGTVGAVTKDCSQPGWAPTTCKKVAELKAKLASAGVAANLPAEIDALEKKLATSRVIGDAAAQFSVIQRLTGWEKPDVEFAVSLFIVAVVGIFSNFGLAIIGGGTPHKDPQHDIAWDYGPRRLAGPVYHGDRGPGDDRTLQPQGSVTGHPPVLHPPIYESQAHVQHNGHPAAPNTLHGAPITINFGAENAGYPAVRGMATVAPVAAASIASYAAGPQSAQMTGAEAAHKPADRSGVAELIDQLLSFRAACVDDVNGAMVAADEMFARYQAWAGPGSIHRAAFETMFPAACKLEPVVFGGQAHFRGVTLRDEPQQLRLVSA